jgi:hypothetical protein
MHGYNVINAAFPVIRSDGTALWEDGMEPDLRLPRAHDRTDSRPGPPARRRGPITLLALG